MEEFIFNKCNVCINPLTVFRSEECKFDYIDVRVAERNGKWVYGYTFFNGCSPCSSHGNDSDTMQGAMVLGLTKPHKVMTSQIDWLETAARNTHPDENGGYKTDLKKYRKHIKILEDKLEDETTPKLFDI